MKADCYICGGSGEKVTMTEVLGQEKYKHKPCPTCKGKGKLYKDTVKLDVPDGYVYVGQTRKSYRFRNKKGRSEHRTIPYKIGDMYEFVCDRCNAEPIMSVKVSPESDSDERPVYFCDVCNGKPTKREVIKMEVVDNNLVIWGV